MSALRFKRAILHLFLCVGLCSLAFILILGAWHDVERWIESAINGARRCSGHVAHRLTHVR